MILMWWSKYKEYWPCFWQQQVCWVSVGNRWKIEGEVAMQRWVIERPWRLFALVRLWDASVFVGIIKVVFRVEELPHAHDWIEPWERGSGASSSEGGDYKGMEDTFQGWCDSFVVEWSEKSTRQSKQIHHWDPFSRSFVSTQSRGFC